jgi:hypothetical protein
MLGTAFEVTGARGLSRTPLKRDYAGHDWRRTARLRGVTYNPAPTHPPIALPTMRAFYALDRRDPAAAVRFAKAAFQAAYVAGRDVGDLAVVLELSGLTAEAVSDPEISRGAGQGPVRGASDAPARYPVWRAGHRRLRVPPRDCCGGRASRRAARRRHGGTRAVRSSPRVADCDTPDRCVRVETLP